MRQALGVRSSRVVAAVLSLVLLAPGALAADHPLKGQKIDMAILGIGGWLPSRLGVDMAPMFAKYAKEKFGYDVTFTFQEAPFSALFQKAARRWRRARRSTTSSSATASGWAPSPSRSGSSRSAT